MAPQATGGPLKKRWPPQKTVASSNIDVQLWCKEIEGVFVKYDMKSKVNQVFKNFEMSLTANVGEWQYIAKNIQLKTNFDSQKRLKMFS